ncbi:MAG: hypothetical protein WC058_01120 [Phycisphaeraceae bacterium]
MDELARDRAVWKGEALSRSTKAVILGIVAFAVIGAILAGFAL